MTDQPEWSFADLSCLLDPPAGKHGFLRPPDSSPSLTLPLTGEGTGKESFAFEDGTPIRFFGINVAKQSVFQSDERILRAVSCFRRAGINLVRFHHLDDKGGLVDYSSGNSRQLDESKLERLDFWVAQLGRAGIYVYLDLLDYRTFRDGDDVANASALGRGAKPMAVFDSRLIQLQKEFARKLLREHVNRYTNRCYADDPTIAFIELYDENGLFRSLSRWRALPEPYRESLRRLWNEWLRKKRAVHISSPFEAEKRVGGRASSLKEQPLLGEAHCNDALEFAYQVHRDYFRTMRNFLRSIGVKVPISAVGDWNQPLDVKATTQELDFLGINSYFDHPTFLPNRHWQLPFFFLNRNPIAQQGEESFPGTLLAVQHILQARKPLVVREWNYCYPNDWRGAGMLEAGVYSGLHGVAALILFTYDLHPQNRAIGYFDVSRDVSRWGLVGVTNFLFRSIRSVRSDTVVRRESMKGALIVDTPMVKAFGGNLASSMPFYGDGVFIHTSNRDGVLVVMSLDQRPIVESETVLVKYVPSAKNFGLHLTSYPRTRRLTIVDPGRLPILTGGKPSPMQSTLVRFGDRKEVSAFIQGGYWEVLWQSRSISLFCDTPQTKFRFRTPQPILEANLVSSSEETKPVPVKPVKEGTFIYPQKALGLRLRLGYDYEVQKSQS